jgi:hypothetical protein
LQRRQDAQRVYPQSSCTARALVKIIDVVCNHQAREDFHHDDDSAFRLATPRRQRARRRSQSFGGKLRRASRWVWKEDMDKRSVILRLHAIAHTRLFGDGPWLTNCESGPALHRILFEMKVEEEVPGDPRSSRSTALGKELHIDLVWAFVGHWDPYDLLDHLEEYKLLTESEADRFRHRLNKGADPESLLRARVQRAYVEYYRPSRPH